MNVGFHHFFHKYKKITSNGFITHDKVIQTFIDRGVYIFGSFGVLVIIPQITEIWINKKVDGVSVFTWIGFLISSIFWLAYGLIHEEKPIIFINLAVILADLIVISGVISIKGFS